MSIDSIGNFLTIIRNGLMIGKRIVKLPSSKMRVNICTVLKDEGYIRDFKLEDTDFSSQDLVIYLKYVNGEAAIHELTRVSKPSRRYYEGVKDITPVIGGLGVSILTTSAGVISDRNAKAKGIGGEVLCHVW
jgi:small subunit ribosomal protein S8